MGVVLALLREVLGEGVHQIRVAGAVAVAEQVGGLVEHGDVLVLVDDRHLGLIGLLFGGSLLHRLCALGREKLVVDVQLELVAHVQPHIPLRALSVDFHPLQADILLGQGGGQQGQGLGQPAVQPLPGVVFLDGKLFHGCGAPSAPAVCPRRSAW